MMAGDGLNSRRAFIAGGAALGATLLTPARTAPVGGGAATKAFPLSVVTDGLDYPEGLIWMKDGSILVSEVAAGRISRVFADGSRKTVAQPGGKPTGGAIGPDGALYVCNSGDLPIKTINGVRRFVLADDAPDDPGSGRIERIDLATGRVSRLYDTVDGRRLQWPDDIVLDGKGGFWITDVGRYAVHGTRYGGLYYGRLDGSMIKCVAYGLGLGLNGIGLSPDGKTIYCSVTFERHLLAFDIVGPGEVASSQDGSKGRVITAFSGQQKPDSLRVTADGGITQTLVHERPGIAQINAAGDTEAYYALPDRAPTSLCFGGVDMRDIWICYSGSGRLVRGRWDRPGLRLAYYA